MRILQRYLFVTIVKAILVVMLMVVGLEIFIIFLTQLKSIGRGDFGLLQCFMYVLFMLPQQSYSLFPIAALLGSLLGLGALANNSELVVMRAAGVSMGKIVWAVLKAALFLVVIMTLIGEVVGPIGARYADNVKSTAISKGQAVKTANGIWIRSRNTFVHARRYESSKHLLGVESYYFNSHHQLQRASYAKQAVFQHGHWYLLDVAQSMITYGGVTVKKFARQLWPVRFKPKMFSFDVFDPQQLSLIGLHNFIHFRKHNGLQAANYALSYWQRILQPFSTAVMMFLAIPFIFGTLRSVTMGLRVLTGISFGFGFYLLNQFFGPLSLVAQIPPLLAAALPPMLFLMVSFLLLRRSV